MATACTSGDGSPSGARPATGHADSSPPAPFPAESPVTAPSPAESPSAEPAPTERPAPRVLAFGYYRRPGFYADQLIALDARSFDPIAPPLRFGDAVTSPVVDPERRLIALGGYNFGKVLLVDPGAMQIHGKLQVTPKDGLDEVDVVAWPRPDRLIGYAQESAAHHLLPGRVFLADPVSGDLVKSVPVGGSVMSATATGRGAAFLVARVSRVDRARVALMDARGELQTVELRKTRAGYVDPGTPGDNLLRDPAIVSVRDKVYVIGAREPVAEIDVRSGAVSYHSVPGLMKGRLRATTFVATGSAGPLEVLRRQAVVVRGARVLVTGDERHQVRPNGHRMREFERVAQIIDLAKWRVRHSFEGLSEVELAGRVVIGKAGAYRVALRPKGEVLFRRRVGGRQWVVVGDRLLEAGQIGRDAFELDVHTGRELRGLGELDPWRLNAMPWPPKGRQVGSIAL